MMPAAVKKMSRYLKMRLWMSAEGKWQMEGMMRHIRQGEETMIAMRRDLRDEVVKNRDAVNGHTLLVAVVVRNHQNP